MLAGLYSCEFLPLHVYLLFFILLILLIYIEFSCAFTFVFFLLYFLGYYTYTILYVVLEKMNWIELQVVVTQHVTQVTRLDWSYSMWHKSHSMWHKWSNNPREFWQYVNKLANKAKSNKCLVSNEEWVKHFTALNSKNPSLVSQDDPDCRRSILM